MEGFLAWLTELPPAALYLALALTAAVENFFPPAPADTVVAFGAFLAARGDATLAGAFLSTWLGNVAGALIVYGVAKRYHGAPLIQRLMGSEDARTNLRLRSLYQRRGMAAIFLSRFLPGVRAIVPPFAGLLRLPFLPVAGAIAVASGVWYGIIAWLAYNAGTNWEQIQERIVMFSRNAGAVAVVIVLIVVAVVIVMRWRARRAP